jgi:D-alanyl-D-alanine carboxypeptidase
MSTSGAGLLDDPGVRSGVDFLSAWIESQTAYAGLPGLSIGVVHDQRLVWARGFGLADVERSVPATPDTLYRIASITKLFTATAIMQLRDAGRLRLDDPLTTHLPWFAVKSDHDGSPPITIRHLLTHTSGLPREAGFPYWTDGAFPDLDSLRARLGLQSQIFATETRWKYSNLALALAGEIVQTASGQTYPEYVRSRILEPLGMSSTLVTPSPDSLRLARGYSRRLPSSPRAPAPWSDLRAITSAASMTTSVADLARFAMLQFRDRPAGAEQVLSGSTLREMQRVHWLEPGWEVGWGLGFNVQRLRGKTYVGHGGALRGYRTELRICPADRMAVIVLTNADDGEPTRYVEKAFDWVGPAIVRAATPARTADTPDPSWKRYLGRYRNPWADLEVMVYEGRLTMVYPALPELVMETRATLVPVANHTFKVESDNGYGIPGELVVFELDASGRVTRVKLGENYADPIDQW